MVTPNNDPKEFLFHKDNNLQKMWLQQYEAQQQEQWDKMSKPLAGVIKKVSFRTFKGGSNTLTYEYEDAYRSYNVKMNGNQFTHNFNRLIDGFMTDIRLDKQMRNWHVNVEKYSSEDLTWQVWQVFNTVVDFDGNNERRNKTVWGVGCLYNNTDLAFDWGKYSDRNMRKSKLTRDGNQYYEYNFKNFDKI